MNFGVIGYGYWGPNVVRNLASLEGSQVIAIAEMSPNARKRAQKAYPGIHVTPDASEVISSPKIDAVAIVTPVWTHYELAKAALENGKHVFVEKPFTSNAAQGEELINLAHRKNLKIMVDHTFLFTGAVKKIWQLLDEGTLGKLYYYDSTRVNLGLFQHDINVLWDLAPHDLSIMDYLIKGSPEAIVATGQKPSERSRRRSLHDALFPGESHRAYQCQLAFPGKGQNHASSVEKSECWSGTISKPTKR